MISSIKELLKDTEPVPTSYPPCVERFRAFQGRFIVTLIDADIPSCTVAPATNPAQITRFEDFHSLKTFLELEGVYKPHAPTDITV